MICIPGDARAHVFEITDVVAELGGQDYRIDVTVDVDALALGVSPQTDSAVVAAALDDMGPEEFERAIERAKSTLLRRTRVRFDDVKQRPAITFPDTERDPDIPSILGVTARLEGAIPPAAREFTVGLSRSFGDARLVIRRNGTETVHLLAVAEDSPRFLLAGLPSVPAVGSTLLRYVKLGFLHIVPRGLDHMLFVLGLFLAGRGLRDLLIRISAFTVAHTVTLGLSAAGLVVIPGTWVEPLIALSIAWIAFESLIQSEWTAWRTGIVFGFGLLHGLGFAGVLGDLGLPEGRFLPALLGFNVGVELGQLVVVLGAWFVLRRFRDRRRIVVPLSIAIGATGLFWAVQRVFF